VFDDIPNIDKNYKIEFVRKAIHFCSLSIPVFYFFLPKIAALSILIPVTALFVVFDVARYYSKTGAKLFYKYFGWLLRNYEIDNKRMRLTGASNILISAIICIIIFPKLIVVTAFAILIISDSSAALIGRRFGKHKFFKKSLEGSVAFFVSAILMAVIATKTQYAYMQNSNMEYSSLEFLIAIIASGIGAVMEASSVVVDDNYTIPLSIGFVMWILYALLMPTFNIYVLG
jgi:dolichol kinase